MTNATHPGPPPKSPARTVVRAHLGDHGHTFVQTKPGITVRDALSKAMKLRKLVPETCAVYRCSDPSKVKNYAFLVHGSTPPTGVNIPPFNPHYSFANITIVINKVISYSSRYI